LQGWRQWGTQTCPPPEIAAVLGTLLAMKEDVMPPRLIGRFSLSKSEVEEAALLLSAVLPVLALVGFRV